MSRSTHDSHVLFRSKAHDGIFLPHDGVAIQRIDLQHAAKLLTALQNYMNRRIIEILRRSSPQEAVCVTDIFRELKAEQSVVSQHLAILRRFKLVEHEKQGRYHYYSLNKETYARIARAIHRFSTGELLKIHPRAHRQTCRSVMFY